MSKVKIFIHKPKPRPKGWKQWMGIFGWNGDTLYLPARFSGMSDFAALLCIGQDGFLVCQYDDVLLAPEEWLRQQKPHMCDVFDVIRNHAVQARDFKRS